MCKSFAAFILSAVLISSATTVLSLGQNLDGGLIKNQASPYAVLRSADLGAVQWTGGFWKDRFVQCREVTLPKLWEYASDWAWHNMQVGAGEKEGEFRGCNWEDAWIYKWVESAAHLYSQTHEPELLTEMDSVIATIAKAQQPDGYLANQITLRNLPRFSNYSMHEVYTMGHLLTAASLHYRITGKTNFLDVAKKVGNFLHKEYTTSKNTYLINCPVNPSAIMGGVELYRTTGDPTYLKLANILIDNRGKKRTNTGLKPGRARMGNTDLNQDRIPLRDSKEVVGHAVFWSYLFAGAADAYMEGGDATLMTALKRLWVDLTTTKMFITGGVSPVHKGLSTESRVPGERVHLNSEVVWEAVGMPYDLPSATAYNETCGQIGNLMWNWRMLAITGEARYADIMEQTLYNSILSGVNVTGEGWSYTNPLRWYGPEHELLSNDGHSRSIPGAKQICCPTNLMRTIASWHGYLYSTDENSVWVHHYGANRAKLNGPSGSKLTLAQETDYPWQGEIRLKIEEISGSPTFSLRLRIPGWSKEAFVKVNGQPLDASFSPSSYVEISRSWKSGDVVDLSLPMPVRLMAANPKIEQSRNQVALARGPIVYCLESIDLPEGVRFEDVHVLRDGTWDAQYQQDLLGGVVTLQGATMEIPGHDGSRDTLYQELPKVHPKKINLQLIPYYAWNNRGEPRMSVWLPLTR